MTKTEAENLVIDLREAKSEIEKKLQEVCSDYQNFMVKLEDAPEHVIDVEVWQNFVRIEEYLDYLRKKFETEDIPDAGEAPEDEKEAVSDEDLPDDD